MNNQENGRRDYGTEGLDKIVMDKRKSLRIDQPLNRDRKNHLIIQSHCSSRRPVNTNYKFWYLFLYFGILHSKSVNTAWIM